jgi:hypothetical protein
MGWGFAITRHYSITDPIETSKLTLEQYKALEAYNVNHPNSNPKFDEPNVSEMLNSKDLKPDGI